LAAEKRLLVSLFPLFYSRPDPFQRRLPFKNLKPWLWMADQAQQSKEEIQQSIFGLQMYV